MDRRELLTTISAGGLGMMAMASNSKAQAPAVKSSDHDKVHADCLEACSSCAKSCDETFHHCYVAVSEGKRDHAKALHLLSDCAGFCSLSACMIAKHSSLMAHSCAACAEACKETVAEVSKFDSTEMKMAAKKLIECEKSCRAMVEHMGHHHTSR